MLSSNPSDGSPCRPGKVGRKECKGRMTRAQTAARVLLSAFGRSCASCSLSPISFALSPTTMDSDHEAYILLLLSDSNLPTGAFVASAGLESYVAHGFFTDLSSPSDAPPPDKMDHTISFLRDSLSTYAHSALPFVLDAHLIVAEGLEEAEASAEAAADRAVERLRELDELYETMTLNHVARRASKSQGVALLTLFSKGFSKPRLSRQLQPTDAPSVTEREARANTLVNRLKLLVRREETHGHLPICWGLLTAALELSSGAN